MNTITLILCALLTVGLWSVASAEKPEGGGGGETGKPGSPDIGKSVGDLGSVKNLVIEGSQVVSAEEIRSALQSSVPYLLAAHPAAPLGGLLDKLPGWIEAGYAKAGHPDANISAGVELRGGTPRLCIHVNEGPGFRRGPVRVEGASGIPAAEIVAALGQPEPDTGKGFAATVIALMDETQKAKAAARKKREAEKNGAGNLPPKGDQGRESPLPTGISGQGFVSAMGASSRRQEPAWKSGDPAVFGAEAEKALAEQVRKIFAGRGFPHCEIACRILRGDAGLAEAVVTVKSTGPQAVIGKVSVSGGTVNSAAEVAAHLGLESGAPYQPSLVTESMLRLWNCGRFLDFWVTAQPRGNGAAEMDFAIELTEVPGAPSLSTALPPGQEALLRAIRWTNESFDSGKRDFVLTIPVTGGSLDIALACDCRMAGAWRGRKGGLTFRFDQTGLSAAGTKDGSPLRAEAPLSLGGLWLALSVLPQQDGDGEWTTTGNYSIGFASALGTRNRFALVYSPASVFIDADDEFTIQENRLVYETGAGSRIETDIATGELIAGSVPLPGNTSDSGGNGVIAFRLAAGEVDRRSKDHTAALAAGPDSDKKALSIASLLTSAVFNLWLSDEAGATSGAGRKLLSSILADGLAEALPDFEKSWQSSMAVGRRFWIPEASLQPGISPMAYVLGGFSGVLEEIFPVGTWEHSLARELFYLVAGDTRFTAQTLDAIAEHPSLGPLGSLLVADVLQRLGNEDSWRFVRRASERDTLADFRCDCRTLLEGSGPLTRAATKALQSVRELNAADAGALVDLAPERQRPLLREALAALRVEKEKPAMDVLRPFLDRLWEEHWRPALQETLAGRLAKSGLPDAVATAAMVNGVPIPRAMVAFLQHHKDIRSLVPRPTGGEAKVSDEDAALAAAIDLALNWQQFRKLGGTINDGFIPKNLWKVADTRRDATDQEVAAALAAMNISRAGALQLVEWAEVFGFIANSVVEDVKPPTDAEVTAYMKNPPPPPDDGTRHIHLVRIPKNNDAAKQRKLAAELLAEARSKGTFDSVWERCDSADETEPQRKCYNKLERNTLAGPLDTAAFALKTGEVSGLIDAGDFICILHAVPPSQHRFPNDDAHTRLQAKQELHQRRLGEAVRANLDRLRANSLIRILQPPRLPAVTPPPAPGFRRLEAESGNFSPSKFSATQAQNMTHWGAGRWSGDKQAFFKTNSGDSVVWTFEIAENGVFDLLLHATRAPDYGEIQVEIDGTPLGTPLDLYAPDVQPSGGRRLGTQTLNAGSHKLTFKITGSDAWSLGSFIGIDALDLRKRN